MIRTTYYILLSIIILSLPKLTSAQIVSGNVFLKGNFQEVGVDNTGAFGSDVDAPIGYHPRGGAGYTNMLGFVADPDADGWAVGTPNYIGDYFLPGGVPHEGWSIKVNGVTNRAWRSTGTGGDFSAGFGGLLTLTGANTSYATIGRDRVSTWEGTMGALTIKQTTELDTSSFYFIVRVKLKNTGAVALPGIYYERSVDPENEYTVPGGSVAIFKEITFQPSGLPGDDNKCLIKTRGNTYPLLSYMGLGTIDCRATAFLPLSGFSPNAELNTYTARTAGSTLFIEGENTTVNSCAGIAFDLGTLAPGDSTNFAYVYILKESYLDSAFARLTPSLGVDSAVLGSTDTIFGCVGEVKTINIIGGDEYNWSDWSPSVGLSSTTGRTNTVTVGTTTVTYRIIGTTLTCPENDTIFFTVVPRVVPDPGTHGAVQVCGNAPIINLFPSLNGSPALGGIWSGPVVTPTGFFNPTGVTLGTYNCIYTTNNGGCTDTASVAVTVINDVGLDFTFDVLKGCAQDTVVFTNLSDSLTSFKWNFADGSPRDTVNYSPTHIYLNQGEYGVFLVGTNARGCKDSLLKLVDTKHPLEASFTQSADSICQSAASTVSFTDASIGNLVSWAWSFGDGGTSTLQNPTHTYTTAGMHTVRLIITDDVPCTDTAYSTVYVDSMPFTKVFTDRDSICQGDKIVVGIDYLNTATSVLYDFGDGSRYRSFSKEQEHSYANTGEYYITISTEYLKCPTSTAFDTIFVKPYPNINLGADTSICLQGAPVQVTPETYSNPANTVYYWSTGDSTAALKIVHPGTYRLTADLAGCTTSDEVVVKKDCYIDIPNSFTPNGDGRNDYFFPRQLLSKGISEFTMTIFDRWGMKIFETSNINGRGWDGRYNGKDQPSGVYIYQMSVKYKNAASENYTGNITLLR